MATYRSRRHPDNGVTYAICGSVLVSSGGCEYQADCWDWNDLERIEDDCR